MITGRGEDQKSSGLIPLGTRMNLRRAKGHRLHQDGTGRIYNHHQKREVHVQSISEKKENHGEEGNLGQSLRQEEARESLPPVLGIHNHQQLTEEAQVTLLIHIFNHQQ